MYKAKHDLILESKYLIWSLILKSKNVEKRKEGEKGKREEERKKRKKEEKRKRYGFCMGIQVFVWKNYGF